jgi:hypothetical protein
MRHGRGLTSAGALAAVFGAWSAPAAACGTSGIGAGVIAAALPSLLIVCLMSVIALLSMRSADRAVARMRQHRDGRGLRVGRAAILVGLGISAAATIVSGGLLLGLLVL